jgi:hypothetical protein
VGKTEIEDALKKLDGLTQEEARMVGARTLGVTHGLENKMEVIRKGAECVQLLRIESDSCCETETKKMAGWFSPNSTIVNRNGSISPHRPSIT